MVVQCVNANCLKHRAIKEVMAIEVTSQLHIFKMLMAIKLINLQFKILMSIKVTNQPLTGLMAIQVKCQSLKRLMTI